MSFYKWKFQIQNKLSTFHFKCKYRKFIAKSGTNIIGKRVTVRPFFNEKSTLSIRLEPKAKIFHDVIIQGSGNLTIGRGSFIGSFSVIGCNEKVTIGSNVMIAQSVSIRDTDHGFDRLDVPMIEQGKVTESITIEDNVWIGHGAVITKGVRIKTGAIIAANAVITKDVEENAIMGGVPAKLIRYRE